MDYGTVHKNPLTPEAVQLLFEKGELACAETRDPRRLMQTVSFYISLYFGKRGRENQRAMKKSMLRLCTTGTGDEYFELNKDEPGTMLSSRNYTGGLEGTEDHSDGKAFALTKSPRCPVNTIKAYLSHLNPDIDVLFQRPRHPSSRFNPNEAIVWYDKNVLGHNLLNNMMRNMSQRAGISPYYTDHSLRATTVTVLSSNNVETRKIKAVTGHRSDTSIESYCAKPTLSQFKQLSSTLSSFLNGEENTASSIIPTPVAPRPPPAESSPTVANSTVTFGRNEANILQAHGVRCPESILPSAWYFPGMFINI
jgi:hypothetical protein